MKWMLLFMCLSAAGCATFWRAKAHECKVECEKNMANHGYVSLCEGAVCECRCM